MIKRSECNCMCHQEGSAMLHIQPCCYPDELDLDQLMGKSETFAKYILEIYHEDYRILHKNSIVTQDYRPDRINVSIDEYGRVFEITKG